MLRVESGWPIDFPRAEVHVEVGHRRHRRTSIPACGILFLCMFLPAVEGCGDQPVYPLDVPYFWHPYLYGAVLGYAALSTTHRHLRRATFAIRSLAWGLLAASVLLTVTSFAFGVVLLGISVILLAVIGTRGVSEKRIAVTGIAVSVMSLLWFGLWSGSPDALIGVYASLAASICLLAGSLQWLSEI